MGKTAFCFPGQLQEKPLWEASAVQEWVERVSPQTRFDLVRFSFKDGTEAGRSLKLQIATYLLSMFYFHQLRTKGWVPDLLLEHSMGIYAALATSTAITFEDGLFITESIGRLLEREAASSPGSMAGIVGLPLEEVEKICFQLDGSLLSIANYNGSMHYVVSGEEEAIEKAIALALSRKAISATRLAFDVALHSPRLSALKEAVRGLLKDIPVQSPRIPILNHWTVQPLRKEGIKEFLSQEIGQPVQWVRCVETSIREGVDRFVEVGHEATLTKLIRWIDRDVEALTAANCLDDR